MRCCSPLLSASLSQGSLGLLCRDAYQRCCDPGYPQPTPGYPSCSTTAFSLHEAVPVASLPLWTTDGLECCRKPGLERKRRIKSISLLHSWKQLQFPGQECVRTAKCSLSQLFLEMLTGRCGPTPLPFVTQRLKELAGPVPFNSSSKEQSQGPLTVVSVTEMGVPFLGGGV